MSLSWSAKEHKNANQAVSTGMKRQRNDAGNKVTVVLGAQWGDEGKGKVVDLLATEADYVCRCQVNITVFFCNAFTGTCQNHCMPRFPEEICWWRNRCAERKRSYLCDFGNTEHNIIFYCMTITKTHVLLCDCALRSIKGWKMETVIIQPNFITYTSIDRAIRAILISPSKLLLLAYAADQWHHGMNLSYWRV